MKIERTVVTAKARKLSATWTVEEPQAVEWININMIVVKPEYKWKPWQKASLQLDRSGYYPQSDMDKYLDSVQAWCQETGNGRRTSYDTFHFSKPAKMTAFLLRWNNG